MTTKPTELALRSNWYGTPKDWLSQLGVWLYSEHVQQADVGADLDFLAGGSGDPVPRQPF